MSKLQDSYKTKTQQELFYIMTSEISHEQDMAMNGYLGPIGCTALLNKYIDKSKKILEVGILEILQKVFHDGINNIDGLDGT